MKRLVLTNEEALKITSRQMRLLESAKRKHLRKKRSSKNDIRLKNLMSSLSIEFNKILYSISFKSHYSFYLYLFLKDKASKQEPKAACEIYRLNMYYCPLEIRFQTIAKELKITRATVKQAYNELVSLGMILDVSDIYFPEHLSCKTAVVFNDSLISLYDKETNKVYFNMNAVKSPESWTFEGAIDSLTFKR